MPRPFLVITSAVILMWAVAPTLAQVMGDTAEMARLRLKAEEAIANDDPDTAAMNMGRAALLAAQIARKQSGYDAQVDKGYESLFRSQEHTYRAMALFRRAGGQLPASSGVCGSLALAQDSLRHALATTDDPPNSSSDQLQEAAAHLRESANNWMTAIKSIITEYQCP